MKHKKLSKTENPRMMLLLAGSSEAEFLRLRDLLARTGHGQIGLDHAPSVEQAVQRLSQTSYNMLLCSYVPGDDQALRVLNESRKNGPGVPAIFLSDHIDHGAMAGAIKAGAYDVLQRSKVDGSALNRAIRYAVDVHRQEEQRQKSEDTLSKLWRAVEQSADMVLITTREGVIEYVNPAFEVITGFTKPEVVGRTPRILRSSQHSQQFYQELWQTILAGHVFRGVVANRRKNGEIYFAEKTISPLRDAEGRITHFISNDRDITEQRKLEVQLQQAQKMDAIGRLAGGIAHDFNNLLMVITAYAELLLEGMAANNPQRRRVQEILGASRRATELTRQLLAFGRKQTQSLQLLDLNRTLAEIGEMLRRLIGEDIEIIIIPARNLGRIRADPGQIEQVIMNLAANARDAMPQGGKLVIETSNVRLDEPQSLRHPMAPPGDYVLLAVSDTGEGIAAEHIANIFEPFYTTKPDGKGTGLGLATVYGIVKQSGAFIWAYSEPKMGALFKIYFPRVAKELEKILPLTPVAKEYPRGSETVLLVEDDEHVRHSAREFLIQSGYTLLEAKNGEEALFVARNYTGPIHVLITDVIMPEVGGAKLAEQLLAERPDVRIVFVSGYAESTVALAGTAHLSRHFLQKPFSLRSLAHKIREALEPRASAVAAGASSTAAS